MVIPSIHIFDTIINFIPVQDNIFTVRHTQTRTYTVRKHKPVPRVDPVCDIYGICPITPRMY